MSRLGRTRRTRVYDCNYNKGESYYRPVLDRLDGKVPLAREPERDRFRSDVEGRFRSDVGESRFRSDADSRFRSAFEDVREAHHDELFDVRGARVQRSRPLPSTFDDDEFTDDITESLKRLRAGKKTSRFAEDIDFENSVANMENRVRISDKILESAGVHEMSGARRALVDNEERTEKRIARRLNEDGLTKWTALKSEDESAAIQRAKASRARLSDLEDEMTEMNERSAAREKRAARLRALVADTEADCNVSSMTASKVTIRADKEKKQVSF